MAGETKWTPGPWKAERISATEIEIGAETPRGHLSVAWVHLGATPTPQEAADGIADATLLASATGLYEALREAVGLLDGKANYHEYQATCFDSIGEPELAPNVRRNEEAAQKARAAEAKARSALAKARGEEPGHGG
jgi:hypothetical protein